MSRTAANRSPVVSFGLPVRNGAPTIGQAIESVLAQTFHDWELVISDNLSTDGTSEICASFAARDERIRHVRSRRELSIHENFRAAFHHSRGKYFRWHGDDDWLEPPYAERTVAALASSPKSVLCTTLQRYYADGEALPVNDPIPILGAVDSPDAGTRVRALLHLLQNGGHLGIDPVYSLARRDVAARTGLQGSIRDGDFVYSCEMALLGPFVHVPEVLAHRRLLPESRTGISRNFLQRERAIVCVAKASKGLTTSSRLRVCAALVAFAAKEHAHGVRRRARAVRIRYGARRERLSGDPQNRVP
jgi:glycosyltransferase involved in cell wall biosynthesis